MPTCFRCRRETDERAGDDLVLRLDGREMLEALRATPREDLDDAQRRVLDRLAAGLCPVCGQAF